MLAADRDVRREVALAEYAGVVPSHPPEELDDERLFRPRRTATADEWKLDAVGDDRRARRIDWAENETESVALDQVPTHTRNKLEECLPDGRPERRGDRTIPDGVEANLRERDYR